MADNGWTWAHLNKIQLDKIAEAERTLGADYVLAYRPEAGARSGDVAAFGLKPAPLSESQSECLHGLEAEVGAVLVAYSGRATAN